MGLGLFEGGRDRPAGAAGHRRLLRLVSGQATGWVLRHGPRQRAMRAVLLVIADAANRDGMHARPGLEALIEGSLRSRSTVLDAIAKLRQMGWVKVEQERRPGHPTVFGIPGVMDAGWKPEPLPNEVQKPDLKKVRRAGPEKGPADRTSRGPATRTSEPGLRSSQPDSEVQKPEFSPYIETVLNGTTTATDVAGRSARRRTAQNGTGGGALSDPLKAAAHHLAVLAHEQPEKPLTRGGFPAVMARIEQALRSGIPEADLAAAIRHGPVTWTADGLRTAVSMTRRTGTSPRQNRLDRQGAAAKAAFARYAAEEQP